jgi:hypothetical protein
VLSILYSYYRDGQCDVPGSYIGAKSGGCTNGFKYTCSDGETLLRFNLQHSQLT